MKYLCFSDLADKGIKYSRTSLARKEKEGSFPKRVPISESRVGWIEAEIEAWMAERAASRQNSKTT